MNSISIETLKTKKVWVAWNYEYNADGNLTKVPKNVHSLGNAKTNDPNTWGTYQEAELAKNSNDYSGVGIVFTDGLCGLDIDSHNGINQCADDVLKAFASTYIEKSPSGNGYHIICLCDTAKLPIDRDSDGKPSINSKGRWTMAEYYSKNSEKELEIYPSNITSRFFTFTGDAINSQDISDETSTVVDFLNHYMKKSTNSSSASSMDKILDKARNASNGKKFSRLFDKGEIAEYENNHSEADMALCSMLAYWFGGNELLIDQAFRQSALFRSKWADREDYRKMTIAKACQSVSKPRTEPTVSSDGKKLPLNLDRFVNWLDEQDFKICQNVITHDLNIIGTPAYLSGSLENRAAYIYDLVKQSYSTTHEDYIRLLRIVADINRFNPVKSLFDNLPDWDGIDRFSQLYSIMHIAPQDWLSKSLIHKWFLMAVALSENDENTPFGADGLLVIQGPQGSGKSSLCNKIGLNNQLCKTGLYINTKDKDTIIRATSCWIAELGEIGYTLKSDVDSLKNFITTDFDQYRVPYGRTETKVVRHTALLATCNDDRFLLDSTGSRRFWTIPCPEKFDLEALSDFNMTMLWKQVESELHKNEFSNEYGSDYQRSFRLSDKEREALDKRNLTKNKLVKSQAEIEDILAAAEESPFSYEWKHISVTDWKDGFECLKHYSSEQVGKALDAIGIEKSQHTLNGKRQLVRYLPCLSTKNYNAYAA